MQGDQLSQCTHQSTMESLSRNFLQSSKQIQRRLIKRESAERSIGPWLKCKDIVRSMYIRCVSKAYQLLHGIMDDISTSNPTYRREIQHQYPGSMAKLEILSQPTKLMLDGWLKKSKKDLTFGNTSFRESTDQQGIPKV